MTSLHPALDDLLARCDELGVALLPTDSGGVRLVYDPTKPIPSDLAPALRPHKLAVAKLLTIYPRPAPDPVLFVAKNLHVEPVAACVAPAVLIHVGDRPHYRLTPRVWFWLCNAVQSRWDSTSPGDRSPLDEAGAELVRLGREYIDRHFRPDQVRRGRLLAATLPVDPTHRPVECG